MTAHSSSGPAAAWILAFCALACEGAPSKDGERIDAPSQAPSQTPSQAPSQAPKTMIPEVVWRNDPVVTLPAPAVPDGRTHAVPESPKPTNVILIVVDTMRSDFTSLVRDEHDATPFMAELAKKAVVYENAFSVAPWTVPSMYSMMTGLFPRQHGMDKAAVQRGRIEAQAVLSERAYTLAEQMRDMGYETFAVCTNQHLAAKYGMRQGFEHFVGSGFNKLPFPDLAMETLASEIRASRRYFLWLHYFDPHHPYGAIHPWFEEWNDSGFRSYDDVAAAAVAKYYRDEHGIDGDAPLPEGAVDMVYRYSEELVHGLFHPGVFFSSYRKSRSRPNGALEKKILSFVKAAYASEIRAADASIEANAGRLRIGEDDLVIVTSDHGEELMEHGRIGHRFIDFPLSQEVVHVPLLIKYPGNRGAGTVVKEAVSLVDILPTIRGVLGQAPLEELPGVDLSARGAPAAASPRPVFAEIEEVSCYEKCVVEYPWKLVSDLRAGTATLFDLSRDPEEKTDLATSHAAIVRRLQGLLSEWAEVDVPAWEDRPSTQLTDEETRQLKALGYVR